MEQIKGMDVSTYLEVINCGGEFYDDGREADLFDILQKYKVNSVRLRLWNDPYSENGNPYGAGNCDIDCVKTIAQKAKEHNMSFLLDLHYSDFWTDPGKQILPKAWRDYGLDKLVDAVNSYTKDVINELKKADVTPDFVQVGNEITNGMLWPHGKIYTEGNDVPNYDNIAKLVSSGVKAVRSECDAKVMIHLDNGGNNKLYREWFDNYVKRGEDFDIIGLSYYPFWHGTFDMLENNMNDIATRYNKDLIVAEVSMGHTMEDYAHYEKLTKEERMGMATRPELAEKVEYPMSKEGQVDFMKRLLQIIDNVPNNHGKGYYYWEPAWIPVPGSGWATEDSLKYMDAKGPCGNEWANQALFDYDGNVLPALKL